MRRQFLILILLGNVLLLAGGCPDPPPPPTIRGAYRGTYEFTQIHSDTDTARELSQPVRVEFRKSEFSIVLTPGVPESLRVMCDMIGKYELGNGVILKCTTPDSTSACTDTSLYPCGVFGLDQMTDTLRLMCDATADTVRYIKKLVLLPVYL